jgi:hypothetical protein
MAISGTLLLYTVSYHKDYIKQQVKEIFLAGRMARKCGCPPHDDRLTPAEWGVVNAGSPKALKETGMSSELRLGPIGQVSRSVRDIAEPERWHRDTLGLPHLCTFGKLASFDCGGTRLYLSQEGAAPEPESILYLKGTDTWEGRPLALMEQVQPVSSPA